VALLGRGEVEEVVVEVETLLLGLHRGEMEMSFLPSELRVLSRSGERARRSRGEPAGLGSTDLGREKDFLLGVRLEQGE
jgi:hypothetical protein